jgi:hypothetical protein
VRADCSLCDELHDALAPWAAAEGCALDLVDVDADPALAARWGAYVPVLLAGEREVCHYRLDRAALAAFFAGARAGPA